MFSSILALLKDYFIPKQSDNPFHYYDEYGHYSYFRLAEWEYESVSDDPDYKKFP
ncbi:hypothetical protein ACFQ88_25975 [Paenibacillus sp. NPDC056579]|uniref:hypothetical protein n=1 Tax=unclassified Paenibacillus TaxID=185978 RepID=UPI001EF7BB32|nr:hypothetical protein [Paenibacillus sp. H1-7]